MEYKSRFPELGFYVDGQLKNFKGGRYVAANPKEDEVLKGIADAIPVEVQKKAEDKPEKPAPKNSAK